MPKLTKRYIESAEIQDKPYFLFDDQVPEFCARISLNGKRHYYLQYMKYKRVKRFALGQHGIITVEKARDEAIAKLAEVKSGGDPQKAKADKRAEPMVEELAERFMEEHALLYCKPRTQQTYRQCLNKNILPFFGDMKITEVTRTDIARFHHSLRSPPTQVNQCLMLLSKMFNLAELWGLRPDGRVSRRRLPLHGILAL